MHAPGLASPVRAASESMPSVVRTAHGVEIARSTAPRPRRPDDVRIDVTLAGICRTDLFVADGSLPCVPPLILGHELAGVVSDCGNAVKRVAPGARVTVIPWVPCGRCAPCRAGAPVVDCISPEMLGMHRDGAFCGAVVVPERCVLPVPAHMSDAAVAFVEPAAAALAIDIPELRRARQGAVLGGGRFQELCLRVLACAGVQAMPLDPEAPESATPGSLDFVVETRATPRTLRLALDLLRPGGTLVLKSRPAGVVAFDVARAVQRRVSIRCVAYGSFTETIDWIATGKLQVEDLLGPTLPLERYAEAFALARACEATKVFLAPGDRTCAA